jgi:ribonuclease BN (tRNA processing enzyme)
LKQNHQDENNPLVKEMKITILGSGTCVPSLARSSCALLVQISGQNLLFDLGPGTMRRLLEAGVDIHDISHVFLSHFHPDHIGELVSFLFANKYPDENQRKIPLTICGGTGFRTFFDQLKSIYKEWIDLSGNLNLLEFKAAGRDAHQFENFKVKTCPVNHREESSAYKITAPNGTTMVYSGDTDYSENLIGLAENADLLVCECALPDPLKVAGHLTPSLAGKIAAAANVKKLVLTHFYPQCEDADINAQCRKTYTGQLALATDLMTFDLGNTS